jgi:hypothetical protein
MEKRAWRSFVIFDNPDVTAGAVDATCQSEIIDPVGSAVELGAFCS